MNPQELSLEYESKAKIFEPYEYECQTGYYFAMARNLLFTAELDHPCPTPERSYRMESLVVRAAVAIKLGGHLEMKHVEVANKKWWVELHFRDGSSEGIKPFRRRKRAESFIANMYLFALTEQKIPSKIGQGNTKR